MADIRTVLRSAIARVFTRYLIGSVLSGVITEVTLLVTYGLGLLGPQASSVAGWAVGAVVNYVLNRRWTWGVRGRPKPVREVVSYWSTAVAGLLISTWATGPAEELGTALFGPGALRVAFVGVVFIAVYGVMFVAKFFLFHYFVFAGAAARPDGDDTEERRSRSQVPTTTLE